MVRKSQLIGIFLSFYCLVSISLHMHAYTDVDERVQKALRVIKGTADDTSVSKAEALATLLDIAKTDSNAYIMNAVGMAYMTGAGTQRDTLQSLHWLEQAGAYGFSEAYHNLGLMYKDGRYGVRRNYAKAFEYFCRGAENNFVLCSYDKGYMLYKGLGCEQDYEAAMECFLNGVNRDHAPSLFMYGLCLRNGYGCEQDTARAMFYLKRASLLGLSMATDELMISNPENSFFDTVSADSIFEKALESVPEVNPEVNDISHIRGSFDGFLVMYDWSGRYVLGEKPISMSFLHEADSIRGDLVVSGDTVPYCAKMKDDKTLKFYHSAISLRERYDIFNHSSVRYKIEKAVLDIYPDRISGRLHLYSTLMREPERPMYFELMRNEVGSGSPSEDPQQRYSRICIDKNPFETEFTATFELQQQTSARVRIYDKYGILVYSRDLGTLPVGINSECIAPNILPGTYVLNISAGKQILRTIIVKKGGAE